MDKSAKLVLQLILMVVSSVTNEPLLENQTAHGRFYAAHQGVGSTNYHLDVPGGGNLREALGFLMPTRSYDYANELPRSG